MQQQLPNIPVIACSSNAQAAKIVAEEKNIVACLGHKKLTDLYDLKLVKEQINDDAGNVTRFVVISIDSTSPTQQDKTSFVFSTVKDRPGSLSDMLQEMAKRSINLTRISSRPSKKMLGEYLFLLIVRGIINNLILKSVWI